MKDKRTIKTGEKYFPNIKNFGVISLAINISLLFLYSLLSVSYSPENVLHSFTLPAITLNQFVIYYYAYLFIRSDYKNDTKEGKMFTKRFLRYVFLQIIELLIKYYTLDISGWSLFIIITIIILTNCVYSLIEVIKIYKSNHTKEWKEREFLNIEILN